MTLIYESAPELDETITIDPDIEDLHYDRTVDRHKVHRAAVSEVFLGTDFVLCKPTSIGKRKFHFVAVEILIHASQNW